MLYKPKGYLEGHLSPITTIGAMGQACKGQASKCGVAFLLCRGGKWQHQGSHSLGQDAGTALWGAGIVGPNDRIHTLLPVGTGWEGRTGSHEETHQTPVSMGAPEPRIQGRCWVWWEVCRDGCVFSTPPLTRKTACRRVLRRIHKLGS